MAKLENLLCELRELNLPNGQFVIFGSGPMGIRRLREINDIDVIVTPDLWKQLIDNYDPIDHDHGLKKITIGKVEILNGSYPNVGSIEELIADADLIDGLPFVQLAKVLDWKRLRCELKDQQDIPIIENFLLGREELNIEHLPGTREQRVFVGGQYDFMPTLREIARFIKEFSYPKEIKGPGCRHWEPIIPADYPIPLRQTMDEDLRMVRQCRYAIFDLSDLGAQLVELQEARQNPTSISSLIVYPARERRNQPHRGRKTVLSFSLPHFGYLSYDELKGIVWRFLTGAVTKRDVSPRIIHDPALDKEMRRARILTGEGNLNEAQKVLLDLREHDLYKSTLEPSLQLAVIGKRKKDEALMNDALTYARILARSDGTNTGEVCYYEGVIDFFDNDWSKVIGHLSKAEQMLPDDGRVLQLLGLALYMEDKEKNLDLAIDKAQKALSDHNMPDPLVPIHAMNDLAWYYCDKVLRDNRQDLLDEAYELSRELPKYDQVFRRTDAAWLDTCGHVARLKAESLHKSNKTDDAIELLLDGLKALDDAVLREPQNEGVRERRDEAHEFARKLGIE